MARKSFSQKLLYLNFLLYLIPSFLGSLSYTKESEEAAFTDTSAEEPTSSSRSVPGSLTQEPITLHEQQSYPLEGLMADRFDFQPPGIATCLPSESGFQLKALHAGKTLMVAHWGQQNVRIPILVLGNSISQNNNTTESASFWRDLVVSLKREPGLKIKQEKNSISLIGEILSRKGYLAFLSLLKILGEHLHHQITVAPGIKTSLIEQALAALASHQLTDIEIASAGHRFHLYGSVSQAADIEQALDLAGMSLPTVENHIPIPLVMDPTVTLRVYILEISKRIHHELGLNWSGPGSPLAQLAPSQLNFLPRFELLLKNLDSQGQARVLAQPFLSVKVGSSAELNAGGEFPIRLTERFENRLVWKHYGLKLRVAIKGKAGRKLRLSLRTESSSLDTATSVGGVPGIRRNDLSTEVDALENQPILLTGLLQTTTAKDVEKYPGLGDVPILGEFFKSRGFREHETELLIALLPKVETVYTKLPLHGLGTIDYDSGWKWND